MIRSSYQLDQFTVGFNPHGFENDRNGNVFPHGIVPQRNTIVSQDNVRLAFAFVCRGCNGCRQGTFVIVFQNDTILTELFLYQYSFFNAFYDKVSTGIVGTFFQIGQLTMRLVA